MTPIVSSGLMMGPFESALRSARALDAKIIRFGLTTVLCGDRHALGDEWRELVAEVAQGARRPRARARRDEGRTLAIENHQDFGSDELVAFCEAARGVGICLDTGNTFPVAEAPLDFTARVAPYVRHRPSQGLSRRSSPTKAIGWCAARSATARCRCADMLDLLRAHHRQLTAVLEPGALEARHVRFLKPEWWNFYAPQIRARRSPPALRRRASTACPTTPTTARPGRAARMARSRITNSP